MAFEIVRNDITCMNVDAIVNTANPQPRIGGGTDFAVYQAAGEEMLEERRRIGEIKPGDAAVTKAYRLPARYVIHAVSPVYSEQDKQSITQLEQAYQNALNLAIRKRCKSVAFPLMGAGTNGFPKRIALDTAMKVIRKTLEQHAIQIYLVVFDHESFMASSELTKKLEVYINEHYVNNKTTWEYASRNAKPSGRQKLESVRCEEIQKFHASMSREVPVCGAAPEERLSKKLKERAQQQGEPFSKAMIRIIDEKGLTDPEVYNSVMMDRKTFNKIKNNRVKSPSKKTALQLCIALHLNLDEAKDFIARAGYAFNPSSKFDISIAWCLENEVYDIDWINATLWDICNETLSNCA